MKNIIIIILVFLISVEINAQKTIKGKVISIITNEAISYASIRVLDINNKMITGTTTNRSGKFKMIIIPEVDSIQLVFTYIGLTDTRIPFVITNVKNINAEFVIGEEINELNLFLTKKDAENDIKNGIIQLYLFAKPIYRLDSLNLIAEKFGFKYIPFNQPFSQNVLQSVNLYNSIVNQFLKERNGFYWEYKFKRKLKKLGNASN